jgi:ppGpp synthetase/RelA/SpoT-type nucleotidyltranferase
MIDALNFIQNQAGVIPQKVLLDKIEDSLSISDVVQRVKSIHRVFEKVTKKDNNQDK